MRSQHPNRQPDQCWTLWLVTRSLHASESLRHTRVNTLSRSADMKINEAQGTYNRYYGPTMESNKEHHTALQDLFLPYVMFFAAFEAHGGVKAKVS